MTNNDRQIENDVREIIERHYGPAPRQASDLASFVAIALFIAVVWLFSGLIIRPEVF